MVIGRIRFLAAYCVAMWLEEKRVFTLAGGVSGL
jgi:hypothetical protein